MGSDERDTGGVAVHGTVTRLHLRSWRFLPAFLWRSAGSNRQARRSDGHLDGMLGIAADGSFWTVTLWRDPRQRQAFRNAAAHARAMPKLRGWCDEAAYARWTQDDEQLPSWQQAGHLAAGACFTRVNHPAADQVAKRPPRLTRFFAPPPRDPR